MPDSTMEVTPLPSLPTLDEIVNDLEQNAAKSMADAAKDKKEQKKRAAPRQSNAQKIESMYGELDALQSCSSLVGDTVSFLNVIGAGTDTKSIASHLALAAKTLTFVQQTMDKKVKTMSKTVDHTNAKKSARQLHRKLTK